MQLRPAYPVDTVTGGCFVTGRYEIGEGEEIIDLDCDLEALPAWGRLCISSEAVRRLNTLLGWEVDARLQAKVTEQRRTISELRAHNRELTEALEAVINAAALVKVLNPVEVPV